MRILFLTIEYFPEDTGIGKTCTQLAEILSSKGHDVIVFTLRKNDEQKKREIVNGVRIHRFGNWKNRRRKIKKGFDFISISLKQIINSIKLKPDAIIGESWSFEAGFMSGIIGKLLRKPSFLRVHASLEALFYQQNYPFFKRVIYSSSFRTNKCIIALHEDIKYKIKEVFGESVKVKIIPHCLKVTESLDFSKRAKKKTEFITLHKLEPNKFNILSVGRLEKVKGYDILIEVMKSFPGCNLYLIGDGSMYHPLKIKIQQEKIKNTFLLGRTSNQNVSEYMLCCDLFISTSFSEGLSIAQLEALSLGIPVASSTVGAVESFISDKINGFLFKPNSVEEIEKTINFILQNKSILDSISKKGFETFLEKFSCDRIVEVYVNLFMNT